MRNSICFIAIAAIAVFGFSSPLFAQGEEKPGEQQERELPKECEEPFDGDPIEDSERAYRCHEFCYEEFYKCDFNEKGKTCEDERAASEERCQAHGETYRRACQNAGGSSEECNARFEEQFNECMNGGPAHEEPREGTPNDRYNKCVEDRQACEDQEFPPAADCWEEIQCRYLELPENCWEKEGVDADKAAAFGVKTLVTVKFAGTGAVAGK